MAFQGILFDFDGTLARTMEDHFRAWKRALADIEVKIEESDYYPLEGMRVSQIAERLSKMRLPENMTASDLVKRKEDYYLSSHRFELYAGVQELIDELIRFQIPIGIVTAALPDRLQNTTPIEFLRKFNAVVTGDKTSRGKPAPDPYLQGATELKLKPESCIAIENAPLGVQSAKGASMFCVGVCSTVSQSILAGADLTVPAFSDLRHLPEIKALFAKGRIVS